MGARDCGVCISAWGKSSRPTLRHSPAGLDKRIPEISSEHPALRKDEKKLEKAKGNPLKQACKNWMDRSSRPRHSVRWPQQPRLDVKTAVFWVSRQSLIVDVFPLLHGSWPRHILSCRKLCYPLNRWTTVTVNSLAGRHKPSWSAKNLNRRDLLRTTDSGCQVDLKATSIVAKPTAM